MSTNLNPCKYLLLGLNNSNNTPAERMICSALFWSCCHGVSKAREINVPVGKESEKLNNYVLSSFSHLYSYFIKIAMSEVWKECEMFFLLPMHTFLNSFELANVPRGGVVIMKLVQGHWHFQLIHTKSFYSSIILHLTVGVTILSWCRKILCQLYELNVTLYIGQCFTDYTLFKPVIDCCSPDVTSSPEQAIMVHLKGQ